MIKTENVEVWGFEHAIRGMRAKGYRKVKSRYETYCSDRCKTINLGTYRTEDEAKEAVINYRLNRFKTSCEKLGLNAEDGIEYEKNYIVFPSGKILNLHGVEMMGAVGRDGYRHVIINGRNKDVHRIIAKTFIPNPKNFEQVNHIDGCKTNNDVSNLEWCTRSDNLKHAYQLGLERRRHGEENHTHKLTNEVARYIKENAKPGDRKYGFAALARQFNVDRTTVSAVYNGETWREA